jgi:hypothetical protein
MHWLLAWSKETVIRIKPKARPYRLQSISFHISFES